MIEVTLQLEEKMSEEEIAEKMQHEFPDISYYTKFRQGKKLVILEISTV